VYHDAEWGTPEHDDRKLFEFLLLEGAQAGLSWLTVLKKREAFRNAFDGFDPVRVAQYHSKKVRTLLADAGIIRNRPKNEAGNETQERVGLVARGGPTDRPLSHADSAAGQTS